MGYLGSEIESSHKRTIGRRVFQREINNSCFCNSLTWEPQWPSSCEERDWMAATQWSG